MTRIILDVRYRQYILSLLFYELQSALILGDREILVSAVTRFGL